MKNHIRKIIRETINDKGLTLSTFNNLPYEYKRGLMTDMVSGEPVEWEEDVPADPSLVNWFNEDEVNYIINQYANVYGNKKFLYGIMNVNDIIEGVMKYGDISRQGWDNFNHYHKWYIKAGSIDHGDSVFPIILSSDEGIDDRFEFIEDGWHRFHSYVDKGIKNIPVIKFV